MLSHRPSLIGLLHELGDVTPHQAGPARVQTPTLPIGTAVSVAGIGSLSFAVLGEGIGLRL